MTRPALLLLLLTLALAPSVVAFCDEVRPDEVWSALARQFEIVDSLSFTYSVSESNGFKTQIHFDAKGTQFRMERADIVPYPSPIKGISPEKLKTLPVAPDTRSRLMSAVVAYNGVRFQDLDRVERKLTLIDGTQYASYNCESPLTLTYAWLFGTDARRRLEDLRIRETWRERFAQAKARERVSKDGHSFVVLDFPQDTAAKVPCVFRVYFARELQYTPLMYDRLTIRGDKLASSMRVERYKTFAVSGGSVTIPTRIRFEDTGSDKVSLPKTIIQEVDESSLRVNEPIEDAIFTIPVELADEVIDTDEERRRFAAAENRPAIRPRDDRSATSMMWLVATVIGAIVVLGGGVYWRRRKSTHA